MHSSRPPRGGISGHTVGGGAPALALPALLRPTHLFGLALGAPFGRLRWPQAYGLEAPSSPYPSNLKAAISHRGRSFRRSATDKSASSSVRTRVASVKRVRF